MISKQLSDLSAPLNERSEQIDRTISTINEKLGRLDLGVEVWLSKPICSTDFKEESSQSPDPSLVGNTISKRFRNHNLAQALCHSLRLRESA